MNLNRLVSLGLFAISMAVGCKKDPPPPAKPAAVPVPDPAAACAANAKIDPTSPDLGGCESLMSWAKNKAPEAYKCLATCQVAAKTKAELDKCDVTCGAEFAKLSPDLISKWGVLNTPTPAAMCEAAKEHDPANPENATCVATATWLVLKYSKAYSCMAVCELAASNKSESDKCEEICKPELAKITPADLEELKALGTPAATPNADSGAAPAAADAGAPVVSDSGAKPADDDDNDGGSEAGSEAGAEADDPE